MVVTHVVWFGTFPRLPKVSFHECSSESSVRFLVAAISTCASAQVYRCVDNKGRTTFSDSPCDGQSAIPVGPSTGGGSAAGPLEAWSRRRGQAVMQMMSVAANEADPDRKRRLRDDVDMAMAAYAAEASAAAQRQAQGESGVLVLEGQLEAARRADRADPLWKPGLGDSPITARIQEQLLKGARQPMHAYLRFLVAVPTISASRQPTLCLNSASVSHESGERRAAVLVCVRKRAHLHRRGCRGCHTPKRLDLPFRALPCARGDHASNTRPNRCCPVDREQLPTLRDSREYAAAQSASCRL